MAGVNPQVQCLAYPANPQDPLLTNWTKGSSNPFLPSPPPSFPQYNFRDPSTAWKSSDGFWYNLVGSGNGTKELHIRILLLYYLTEQIFDNKQVRAVRRFSIAPSRASLSTPNMWVTRWPAPRTSTSMVRCGNVPISIRRATVGSQREENLVKRN
jgi:hypothetical protein